MPLDGHPDQSVPDRIAVEDGRAVSLTAEDFQRRQRRVAARLRALGIRRAAIVADNGVAAFTVHAAADRAGVGLVPLPPFFSVSQIQHAITVTHCDAIFTDRPEAFEGIADLRATPDDVLGMTVLKLSPDGVDPVPGGVTRITFTSGTTGTPKGVCLTGSNLAASARSLIEATESGRDDVHLALLPLAVLLEEVVAVQGGVYSGARIVVPSLAEVGFRTGGNVDGEAMLSAIHRHRATVLVLTPELLEVLTQAVSRSGEAPPCLRFVAVGGAPVSRPLLRQARALGLPVYEGYGLSEAASVVALNTSAANRPTAVGKALPQCALRVAHDGELMITGNLFLGYLDEQGFEASGPELATGDLAEIDSDGFLSIVGRKKNVIVTSNGRNISPEWVERAIELAPSVRRAFVFGDGQSHLSAVIEAADPEAAWSEEVRLACLDLPIYARLGNWVLLNEPLCQANGTIGATGKPDRLRIQQLHEGLLNPCDAS